MKDKKNAFYHNSPPPPPQPTDLLVLSFCVPYLDHALPHLSLRDNIRIFNVVVLVIMFNKLWGFFHQCDSGKSLGQNRRVVLWFNIKGCLWFKNHIKCKTAF